MASIRLEVPFKASADKVWDVVRDVGAVHTRFTPGFVTDCRLDGEEARIVTFANGFVARELIVDVNDRFRRLAYSVVGSERMSHHNASFQVEPDGKGARMIWIADILPNDAEPTIRGLMEQGAAAMRKAIDGA